MDKYPTDYCSLEKCPTAKCPIEKCPVKDFEPMVVFTGLFYHAAWFTQPHNMEGFQRFLDTILSLNDVWFVTSWQAIQWMRNLANPVDPLNFEPFQCKETQKQVCDLAQCGIFTLWCPIFQPDVTFEFLRFYGYFS